MQPISIKFVKTHTDAQLPKQNHGNLAIGTFGSHVSGTHDSGFDVFCCENTVVPPNGSAVVPTGIQLAGLEPGYWIRIEARSGLGFKHGLQPHSGIIDNQYRGDLGVKIFNHSDHVYRFQIGDRIAQLVLYKLYDANISWADQVDETTRGQQGIGSSGT